MVIHIFEQLVSDIIVIIVQCINLFILFIIYYRYQLKWNKSAYAESCAHNLQLKLHTLVWFFDLIEDELFFVQVQVYDILTMLTFWKNANAKCPKISYKLVLNI